ncbi:leukotriene A-4 hydrolase-like isoform X1 [Varroa jacobsoni]|uniref:leukotriene A-4 hydrolase-like isoform X1 n=1 Tax=Varroa jacobsoni TaxID=62625 RepID=UPI000BF63E64|nr:leukotriene A-4 hydrolase-like isoform X1 [Varroa jacobsoni]
MREAMVSAAQQHLCIWLIVVVLFGEIDLSKDTKPLFNTNEKSDTNVQDGKMKTLSTGFIYDPSSRSNPNEAVTKRFHWRASVNFQAKEINAVVRYDVIKQPGAQKIVLDASLDLKVHSVEDVDGNSLTFERLATDIYGAPLSINLPENINNITIVISYSTSPTAGALQWLEPAQTLEKKQPFMYSQNQPIFARSMIPCQDTPQVKMTFFAEVQVPESLVALMGAKSVAPRQPRQNKTTTNELQEIKKTKMFRFRQDIPVPAYLIAIAVGDVKSRRIGRISEVWAEKGYLETAVHDFSDIDKMLDAAERIVGAYRFAMYNILVLPPSFPYGGMENPCLTFVTPTLLTGDKSLTNVITHEIAHSWFGNLVTTKTYEHFWLNEGFTVFLERKIQGALFGSDERKFSAKIGYIRLKDIIEKLSDFDDTRLVTNLTGRNPHDMINRVGYEKGHTFLWYLEQLVGGDKPMNAFLKSYVDQFAYKAVESDEMKDSFVTFFATTNNLTSIDWNAWLHGRGLPSYVPDYSTSLEAQVDRLLEKWRSINHNNLELVSSNDIKNFSPQEKIAFLTKMNAEKIRLTANHLEKMSTEYGFDVSKNSEITTAWLVLALRNRYEPAVEPTKGFLRRFGRIKFMLPLLEELLRWPEQKSAAEQLLNEIRPRQMQVTQRLLDMLSIRNCSVPDKKGKLEKFSEKDDI